MQPSQPQILHSGKWIQLNMFPPSFEYLNRLSKKNFLPYDALTVVPLLFNENEKTKIILIAQYRPPVNNFVLELPAGLAENKDFFLDCQRELEEETGYKSTEYFLESKPSWGDPDFIDVSAKLIVSKVKKSENPYPKQKLEEEENIVVHLVDFDENFSENIEELARKNNYIMTDKLRFIAMGLKNQIKK